MKFNFEVDTDKQGWLTDLQEFVTILSLGTEALNEDRPTTKVADAEEPSPEELAAAAEAKEKADAEAAAEEKKKAAAEKRKKAAAEKKAKEEAAAAEKKAKGEAEAKAKAEAEADEDDGLGLDDEDEDDGETYTQEDVKKALQAYMKIEGKPAAIKIMKDHGASNLTAIKEEDYASVIRAAKIDD